MSSYVWDSGEYWKRYFTLSGCWIRSSGVETRALALAIFVLHSTAPSSLSPESRIAIGVSNCINNPYAGCKRFRRPTARAVRSNGISQSRGRIRRDKEKDCWYLYTRLAVQLVAGEGVLVCVLKYIIYGIEIGRNNVSIRSFKIWIKMKSILYMYAYLYYLYIHIFPDFIYFFSGTSWQTREKKDPLFPFIECRKILEKIPVSIPDKMFSSQLGLLYKNNEIALVKFIFCYLYFITYLFWYLYYQF